MTPRQFQFALEDWQRDKELERELAFISADAHLISEVKTSEKLIKFPWEIKDETKPISSEQWAMMEKK